MICILIHTYIHTRTHTHIHTHTHTHTHIPHQADVIVLAPDEIQRQTVSVEVQERMKAGKKRIKKLRQRMAGRMREHEVMFHYNSETETTSKHHQRYLKYLCTYVCICVYMYVCMYV